jgi:hypothetical protein
MKALHCVGPVCAGAVSEPAIMAKAASNMARLHFM